MSVLAVLLALAASVSPPQGGAIQVARLDGIVHPLSAEYLVDAIERADEQGAALLLIEVDTPGGLVDSTKEIVQRMLSARTPIAVYVSPSGARAASAGFLLLIGADIAAMAPGTNTGAAHPIDASGAAPPDDIGMAKAQADLAAFARTLASNRGRNVELAEKAVTESAAFTENEALDRGLIDFVARDRGELLERLEGRRIRRFDGSRQLISTRGPVSEALEPTLVQRLVGPLLRPELVLLLLGVGMLGLYVEFTHPGLIFPGVIGVLCLLLFALAFHYLPINAIGLLLVALGAMLFVLELKITSHGLLALGGVTCLWLGLLMLLPRDVPALRVSPAFVTPLALAIAATMACIVVLASRAQHVRVATGIQAMIGEIGSAESDIDATGKVHVHGELWDARSDSPIARGADVRVVAVEGLKVVVEKKESSS
jgi:membrane-bound serine protease (ClpP class)